MKRFFFLINKLTFTVDLPTNIRLEVVFSNKFCKNEGLKNMEFGRYTLRKEIFGEFERFLRHFAKFAKISFLKVPNPSGEKIEKREALILS